MFVYLVLGIDAHTFSMFTPAAFLCEEAAERYVEIEDDANTFFRIEKIPLYNKEEMN